jgi:hypothetical protein
MDTHESNESHGLVVKIDITPATDVDAICQHIRKVIECITSAGGEGVIMTGEIDVEQTIERDVQADPEPEPAETNKNEYRFPPFGE